MSIANRLPTLIPLSGISTTCFHHVVIKIRHLFLRPAVCLTSTLLQSGVDYSQDDNKPIKLISVLHCIEQFLE
jgi:hypothetical protein